MEERHQAASDPVQGPQKPCENCLFQRGLNGEDGQGPSLQVFFQEAVIGSLMSGIAHEFMNPLGFVQANLGSLQRYASMVSAFLQDLEQHDPAVPLSQETIEAFKKQHNIDFVLQDLNDVVSQSLEGTHRIENLLVSLRSFITPTQEPIVEVDLLRVLDSVLGLAWNRIKYKAKVKRNLPDLPTIQGYSGQLAQALLNLLLNAATAIDKDGIITISAEVEAGQIQINFTDNGCGIKPDHLDKIFTPYFSAWDSGLQVGLGLTITSRILKQHGGDITVQSTPGEGATFALHLPIQLNSP